MRPRAGVAGRALRALGVAALLGAPLLGSACAVEAFCFAGCGDDSPSSGGSGGAPSDGGGSGGSGNLGNVGGGTGGSLIDAGCQADTLTDLENCGECGHRCELPAAFPRCVAGRCEIQECAAGYYDYADGAADGCEYQCPFILPETEICDGLDNDCDQLVDGDDPDLAPPPGACTRTSGTPCAAAVAVCDGATGTWSCTYPPEVETDSGFVRLVETLCDGLDGNCDGQVDETFLTLGMPCDNGGVGVCLDPGAIACDPNDPSATLCDLSLPPDAVAPGAEACNGLDDDCDGLIDEEVVHDMLPIPDATTPLFFVDRYEASRADATGTSAGVASGVACVRAGVLPWTATAWAEANAACEARGANHRLCTAAELLRACEGPSASVYPYGGSYAADACNGVDHDGVSGGTDDDVLLATGTLAACTSADGAVDLSGNATEWTSTKTGETGGTPNRDIYQLHGGSYLSPSAGLECSIDLAPRAAANAILANIGFRCCRSP
ncbi:MAG: SUMF1/EgtB/PvdO family nonheme iron enzyme [Polyangiaceae bacterium]|nr:SUMF1/EgtB/PvdO family nonheme iron enzyme [Polyangiaceae bacterium]